MKIQILFVLALVLVLVPPPEARAAQVGIKYNRAKWEYPEVVLADFKRFHDDRINTVMISLPWAQWEPSEGQLDGALIKEKLAPILEFCEKNKISVVLSSHCSFWGNKGNWSLPEWLRKKPGFRSSTSAMTSPALRIYHVSFLNRWIDATRGYSNVVGYNILNEPVSATKEYLKSGRKEFDARWEGTIEITKEVRRHMKQIEARQFLIVGNASCDVGFDKWMWKHTGKVDLMPFWTKEVDLLAAQNVQSLLASSKWYRDFPRMRTESSLNFALLKAIQKIHNDFTKLKIQWSPAADYTMTVYDYDSVYDFEGLANAAVPNLKAFYVWRIGSPDGSKNLLILDHRHGNRPTPYYWALRDLASGVDSFETLDAKSLPKNGQETLAFNPQSVKPGISKRWQGSGKIVGQRKKLPPGTDSTMAAEITLEPGQSVFRSVISFHWKDNGVSAADAFTFLADAEEGGEIVLIVRQGKKEDRHPLKISAGKWASYRVPFHDLGLKDEAIGSVDQVGLVNESPRRQIILIDEFVIR